MKTKFNWYYRWLDCDKKKIFEEGTLVLDTNVLLDLYRVNKDTRDTLKDIIDSFGTRIWIPYHVAYEFLKNRNTVKNTSQQMFATISNNIKNFESEIINSFNKQIDTSNIRLKNTSEFSKEIENFKDSISTIIKNFNEKIEKHGEELNNDLQHNDIISWIFKKFNGHVGEPFENEAEIIEEAKKRISEGKAPGISDTNKETNKYGDYFIWKQILDYASNTSRNVIFVTSEKKADWWERDSGITSIKFEFYEDQKNITNFILLYNIENFIKDFNEYNKKTSTQAPFLNNKRLTNAIEEFTALIPPKHEKIVSVEGQWISKATRFQQIGKISFELKKDIYYFTISGEVSPNMYHSPFIRSHILSCPPDTPKCSLRYGTGTVYDFNIHIKSMEYGKKMPAGLYVIEYSLEDPLAFEAADDDQDVFDFPDDDNDILGFPDDDKQ